MSEQSEQASPSRSIDELERLVQHFVAAKRSLSSTALVSRAHDVVTTARRLVEETAVLSAKNAFVRQGVLEEANVLVAVRDGLDSIGRETDVDFKRQAVIHQLDLADNRLQATLVQLTNTQVDTSELHSRGATPDKQKTLHDFIDEDTHLNLIESLRSTIDSHKAAEADFQHSQDSFDDQIHLLDAAVNDAAQATENQDNLSPIPPLFHALTAHATETASLLSSLVAHYDLCTSALKHTEGGGEAARQANPSSAYDAPEDSLYKNLPLGPLNEQERQEMLAVVDNDAQEVEDVVLEIGERLSEMETTLDQLQSHSQAVRLRHKLLNRVLELLRTLGGNLPMFIAAAKLYGNNWNTLKETLLAKAEELASLTDFYESFITSYASLLEEVNRRHALESRMQRIADKARRELEALYKEDFAMREDFVRGTGEFLPRDIWPGLIDAPRRWEVRAVSPESRQEPLQDSGEQ
ncbi:APG17-domain-containing protein [Aureobasidium sp. EXF-10727]|nr:APG17-domain-containing protein [Aureobasidium sp. EXF-10727]